MTPGGFPGSGRVGQGEPLMFLFVFKLLSDSWLAAFVINDNDFSSTASRIDGLARGARSHVATEGAQLFDLLRNTGLIKNVYERCAI